MLLIVGIAISFFLSGLLLLKKHKSRADKILLLWLLFMALHQSMIYFQISGVFYEHPYLLGISFPFPVLQGLMLIIYISEISGTWFKNIWDGFLHLLPAISLALLPISFYQLSPNSIYK